MMDASEENTILSEFLKMCDAIKTLGVRTNGETPEDAYKALQFGAERYRAF